MKIPLNKVRAMIKYFAQNTDEELLGKVKLMKLFYFSDFTHTKHHGQPITFDYYIKLEHGPIPSKIKNLVDEAEEDPETSFLSDLMSIEKQDNCYLHKIVAKKPFTEEDAKLFSKSELDVLRNVCKKFYNSNTKAIETASHQDGPWEQVEFLGEIPYALVFNGDDEESKSKRDIVKFLSKVTN